MREQQTEGETDEMIALIEMIERQNDRQRERLIVKEQEKGV